jgi:hypothetical protein
MNEIKFEDDVMEEDEKNIVAKNNEKKLNKFWNYYILHKKR